MLQWNPYKGSSKKFQYQPRYYNEFENEYIARKKSIAQQLKQGIENPTTWDAKSLIEQKRIKKTKLIRLSIILICFSIVSYLWFKLQNLPEGIAGYTVKLGNTRFAVQQNTEYTLLLMMILLGFLFLKISKK